MTAPLEIPVERQAHLWEACAKPKKLGHRLCPARVLAQAPWATAGDPPPHPGALRVRWIECPCPCHGGAR